MPLGQREDVTDVGGTPGSSAPHAGPRAGQPSTGLRGQLSSAARPTWRGQDERDRVRAAGHGHHPTGHDHHPAGPCSQCMPPQPLSLSLCHPHLPTPQPRSCPLSPVPSRGCTGRGSSSASPGAVPVRQSVPELFDGQCQVFPERQQLREGEHRARGTVLHLLYKSPLPTAKTTPIPRPAVSPQPQTATAQVPWGLLGSSLPKSEKGGSAPPQLAPIG